MRTDHQKSVADGLSTQLSFSRGEVHTLETCKPLALTLRRRRESYFEYVWKYSNLSDPILTIYFCRMAEG